MPGPPPRPAGGATLFRPATPLVIGLLGGIAAGKSTVARLFAERGLQHVDADAHARAVAEEPGIVREIARRWPSVVAAGTAGRQTVDRSALARIVFADPRQKGELEALLHPTIRARLLADVEAARARGTSVLLDVPLLLENGMIDLCDHVVFVHAADAVRARRAAERGWSSDELARREAAQAALADKAARASHRIDNDGDLDETRRQVEALLASLEAKPR